MSKPYYYFLIASGTKASSIPLNSKVSRWFGFGKFLRWRVRNSF